MPLARCKSCALQRTENLPDPRIKLNIVVRSIISRLSGTATHAEGKHGGGGVPKWTWWFLLFSAAGISLPHGITLDSTLAIGGTVVRRFVPRGPEQAIPLNQRAIRTKIAEGEYAIIEEGNQGTVGPFVEEIYNFHETWTLSRIAKGQFEVEGERRFEFPRDFLHADWFLVQLSRDLTVTRVTEFAKLRWIPDSGPLSCEFLPTDLSCSSGGRDPKYSIHLHTHLDFPYGLLWPVSAFSLSGLTREAERAPRVPARVQLVTIEQPHPDNPVSATTLDGELHYLGDENVELAGQNWRAFKFSLKVAMHPEFLIWTSRRGLLLAVAVEHARPNWPEEGMKLVRFQEWGNF